MKNLHKRGINFLQKRFPKAPVLNKERGMANSTTGEIFKQFHPIIALDPDSGIKQRMLAVPDFNKWGQVYG